MLGDELAQHNYLIYKCTYRLIQLKAHGCEIFGICLQIVGEHP